MYDQRSSRSKEIEARGFDLLEVGGALLGLLGLLEFIGFVGSTLLEVGGAFHFRLEVEIIWILPQTSNL